MSASPNPIPLSKEEDTWIAEHIAVIKAMKQVKVEHQRLWEEEAAERQQQGRGGGEAEAG